MKAEDYFRLVLKEVMNCDEKEINHHFKEFRKNHRQFSEIIGALEKEIADQDGTVINDMDIV